MSHEIRTPMNSIMGFAELAQDRGTEPRQMREDLSKISESTKWLLRIVNDILDISKIESGKMELEHAPFELQEVISRCQSVILPGITDKGLELIVYAEALNGKKIYSDSVRLYQALMNLLSNALKFTETGAINLSATVRDAADNKASIYFEVRDTGIGMTPAQVKKIFDPFIQADSSTTRNYGGTGLGLAITKNIVELMGGELTVNSAPGKGSTFSFEVVFETVDASDDAPASGKTEIIEKPLFNGEILICDDNHMNRQVICEHLANVGIKAVTAENGKEGVEKFTKRAQSGEKLYDLVFMDIFMPIMDGLEAATLITEINTGVPIVAMTANVMAGEKERYKAKGMPDCLGKPFTSQELWRVLLKYLTPVGSSVVDEHTHAKSNEELRNKLRVNFVKNNQNVFENIMEAIANNDITLAHRLAHTLKGNAGQIGETALQNAAAVIEKQLTSGLATISGDSMDILKTEFTAVMEVLKPFLDGAEKDGSPISGKEKSDLFEKLEEMLENINPECIGLLDDIRAVSGTEELANLVERFDFENAAIALAKLKKERAL
jgi:signal transduction histidine kinase